MVPTKVSHPLLRRVGSRIRKARRERGLSQEALAHAADMDRSYVSGLERGEFNVSLLHLSRLAHVLGVRVESLISQD